MAHAAPTIPASGSNMPRSQTNSTGWADTLRTISARLVKPRVSVVPIDSADWCTVMSCWPSGSAGTRERGLKPAQAPQLRPPSPASGAGSSGASGV